MRQSKAGHSSHLMYSMGRNLGRPINALPQSPQWGPFAFFFSTCSSQG